MKKAVFNAIFWVMVVTLVMYSYHTRNRVDIPMVGGVGMATVDSGSMEPNLHVGSLIVLKNQDTYSVGDIVTYNSKRLGVLITHRVVERNNGFITTKGDANTVPDPSFSEELVVGRVVTVIPYVGYIVKFLRNPIVISCALSLAVLCFLGDIVGYGRCRQEELLDAEQELSKLLLEEEELSKPIKKRRKKTSNSSKSSRPQI